MLEYIKNDEKFPPNERMVYDTENSVCSARFASVGEKTLHKQARDCSDWVTPVGTRSQITIKIPASHALGTVLSISDE